MMRGMSQLRHPDFPDREDMWRYNDFATVKASHKETTATSAEYQATADVEEDQMLDNMRLAFIALERYQRVCPSITLKS